MTNMRKLIASSAIRSTGAGLSIICQMAYYMIAIRHVDTVSYAGLQTLMSLTFFLYPGRGVAASYIVIRTGGDEKQLPSILHSATRISIIFAMGTMASFVLAAPFARSFLRLESMLPLCLIGVAALPCMISGYLEGILNVQKKFLSLTIATLVMPIMTTVGALLFLRDGFMETEAAYMILLSQFMTLVVAAILIDKKIFRTAWSKSSTSSSALRDAAIIFAASIMLGLTFRFDVLWAKHVLDPTAAGLYSIAASIAIVLNTLSSGTAGVTSVMFRKDSALRIVAASYAIIISMCGALAGSFFIVGDRVLEILTGHSVDIDWTVLGLLFLGMTLHALASLDFTCLNVVTKRMHAGLALTLVVAQGCALWLFGTSSVTIAITQCVVMGIFMVLFGITLVRAVRRIKSPVSAHPAEHHFAQNA